MTAIIQGSASFSSTRLLADNSARSRHSESGLVFTVVHAPMKEDMSVESVAEHRGSSPWSA